jgi:hypothetical protein
MTELNQIRQQLRWLNSDRRRISKCSGAETFRENRLRDINARILELKIRRDAFQPKWVVKAPPPIVAFCSSDLAD